MCCLRVPRWTWRSTNSESLVGVGWGCWMGLGGVGFRAYREGSWLVPWEFKCFATFELSDSEHHPSNPFCSPHLHDHHNSCRCVWPPPKAPSPFCPSSSGGWQDASLFSQLCHVALKFWVNLDHEVHGDEGCEVPTVVTKEFLSEPRVRALIKHVCTVSARGWGGWGRGGGLDGCWWVALPCGVCSTDNVIPPLHPTFCTALLFLLLIIPISIFHVSNQPNNHPHINAGIRSLPRPGPDLAARPRLDLLQYRTRALSRRFSRQPPPRSRRRPRQRRQQQQRGGRRRRRLSRRCRVHAAPPLG